MSMVVIVVIALLVGLAVWYSMSNQGNDSRQRTHQRITPQSYQTSYAQRDHLLVDVRTAEEFGTGHIPGAINIALPTLPERMDTLPKDRPIILYCRSGARSDAAAKMLVETGFEDVHDLGGITSWQAQGLPVSKVS